MEVINTAAREHVGEIERQIRLIKERTRCSTSDMLYCGMIRLHNQSVIHLVYNACLWLNVFPFKLGISIDYSPRGFVTQRSVSYKTDFKAEFGSYIESSTDTIVTNSQIPMCRGFIAIGTSGNRQG